MKPYLTCLYLKSGIMSSNLISACFPGTTTKTKRRPTHKLPTLPVFLQLAAATIAYG